ncbi:MAG: DNA-processing protein DprA [Oscillospiraceae bacterium]|jgi:DNA processing protein|nr:DNA-processing protein DprA [Oscillospiraceae bacterium]
MEEAQYWVWLQQALGISAALRTQEIVDAFGGARELYDSSDYARRVSGVLTNLQLTKLAATPLSAADSVLRECARDSLHILTPQDPGYPTQLRALVNFPLALYVWGSLDCLRDRLALALVGTRHAARKSLDIAARLSGSLARAGCAVVSGGALGIDSAAHRGALEAEGWTVAVLGCGIRTPYLPENAEMRARIAKHGAVISEYPARTPALGHHFPVRNRIISGLSFGTIVVEADERSGSLITAQCAAEQGRDVFAVPGDAFGSTYNGGNKLIREGARPVFSAMDVLEDYAMCYPELVNMRRVERDLERSGGDPDAVPVKRPRQPGSARPSKPRAARAGGDGFPLTGGLPPAEISTAPPPLADPLQRQVAALLAEHPAHIDALAKQTGAALGELFAALTALEMEGRIRQLPGKLYEAAG